MSSALVLACRFPGCGKAFDSKARLLQHIEAAKHHRKAGSPAGAVTRTDHGRARTGTVAVRDLRTETTGATRRHVRSVCETVTESASWPPHRAYDVTIAIDTSGSMSGSLIASAKDAAINLVDGTLHEMDRLRVLSFDTRVHAVQDTIRKRDVNFHRVIESLRTDGSTALWDAIDEGINGLRTAFKRHGTRAGRAPRHFELVVLTDGGDNSSKTTFEAIAERVATPGLPNFHLTVIPVGGGCDMDKLRALARPRHCTIIKADDGERIREAFGKVAQRIQLERTRTVVITERVTAVGCVPHGLPQARGRGGGRRGRGGGGSGGRGRGAKRC